MFSNSYELTGTLKFAQTQTTPNGNMIFSAILGRGNKEKGYQNYPIKAFKDTAAEMKYIDDKALITCRGYISQDNYEKDGKKVSRTFFVVTEWDAYKEEQ